MWIYIFSPKASGEEEITPDIFHFPNRYKKKLESRGMIKVQLAVKSGKDVQLLEFALSPYQLSTKKLKSGASEGQCWLACYL